jgi:hypothetical protein
VCRQTTCDPNTEFRKSARDVHCSKNSSAGQACSTFNGDDGYEPSGGCLTGLCGVGGEPIAGSGWYPPVDGMCCNEAAVSAGCTKVGSGGYRSTSRSLPDTMYLLVPLSRLRSPRCVAMMSRAIYGRLYTKGCEAGSGACTDKAGAGESCESSDDCYGGAYSTGAGAACLVGRCGLPVSNPC